VDEKLSYTCEI